MRSTYALLLTIALSLPTVARGADCKLAHSPREQAICSGPHLSALDNEISASYKSLHDQLSPQSAALLESDQHEWSQWIDLVCSEHPRPPGAPAEPPHHFGNLGAPGQNPESLPGAEAPNSLSRCLQDQYTARARDFKKSAHIGAAIIFSRAHFLYKSGADLNTTAINNVSGPEYPGFGYGTLRWPQIDIKSGPISPTDTAWNNAIRMRASRLSAGISDAGQNATFDTAVNALENINADYTLDAANGRLIEVSLTVNSYVWVTGASPLNIRSSFLWWLDRNRELTAEDIFNPASAWADFLASVATGRLQENERLKPLLREDAVLSSAVGQSAPQPTNWTLTKNGLTVTFPQGMVAANPAGMPRVFISWEDLKAFLEPNLNTTTLPTRLPKSAQ